MSDQLALLTPDAGRSARSLARRVTDPASGVKITERCADVLPFLRREAGPVTAHQIAGRMLGDERYEWAAPNTVARRLGDLENMGLAKRVGEVTGKFGRSRFLWVAS
jgi:hypothetical protein